MERVTVIRSDVFQKSIEDDLNEWLKKNSGIEITRVVQAVHPDLGTIYTTIFYKR